MPNPDPTRIPDWDQPERLPVIQPVWRATDGTVSFSVLVHAEQYYVMIPGPGWSLQSHLQYGSIYRHTFADRRAYTARGLFEAARAGRDGFRLATEVEVYEAVERCRTTGGTMS